jgi:phosphate butyryltransferase
MPEPKVAVLAPVETVNPTMPECVDAAMLSKACERGELRGCVVDGPLSLDLALSREAAVTKGVHSAVAGQADILLVPNLVTGNVLDKAIRLLAGFQTAGAILGAKMPFIATSRSDSAQNKLNTIAVAALQFD